MTEFFAEQDEVLQGGDGGHRFGSEEPATSSTTARTLGGQPVEAPPTAKQSSSGRKSAPKKGVATLGDYATGHEESEDEDDTENQDFFAGGGKSGLAVQNPDDVKRKIIEKAQR